MENEIRDFINEKISQIGIGSIENFSPKIQEQLYQIEEYIHKVISEQEQIQKKIKEYSKLNVLSITKGANVQRSTVYNNPNTLKKYIEVRIEEIQKQDILGINELEKFKQKTNELSDCLEGFQENIVENHILLIKIKELEAELKNLGDINQSISKQNNVLTSHNDNLRRQLKNQSGNSNVVPYK